MLRLFIFFLAICLLAVPAVAQVSDLRIVDVDNSSVAALDGYVTNDVLIDFSGQYTGGQMIVQLSAGDIYQDAGGGVIPPTEFIIGLAPSAAFDTFVAQGLPTADGPLGNPSPGGGAVDLGGAPGAQFDTAGINQAWNPAGGADVRDQTDFLLARVSLSADAAGTAAFLASAEGSPQTFEMDIVDGVIGGGGPMNMAPVVGDLAAEYTSNPAGVTVMETLSLDDPDGPPGSWALESFDSPNGQAAAVDAATGQFSWLGNGSPEGVYDAVISYTDGGDLSDTGTLSITWHVPEPATCSLAALAMLSLIGLVRRRS